MTAAPARLDAVVRDARAWTRATLGEEAVRIRLSAACLEEIDALVRELERDPVPTWLLDPADYALAECRAVMAEVRRRLDDGPGVVQLARLPVEGWSRRTVTDVFWLLGVLVGRPVVQTLDGQILVEVTDTGVPKRIGVRGFRTNVAQPPHVDNSFNHAPPEYVSLVMLRAAREGGVSRFVSFYTVHNRLLEQHPDLLARLYEPFYQDRQGDFWPDEPQTARYPVFALDPGLRCRYTHFTIPAGYRTAGVEMDPLGRAAFEAMTRVIEDPALYHEVVMAPGELQFVNNRYCGHGRTGYVDLPDPARKRLLLRLWHRDGGKRRYRG